MNFKFFTNLFSKQSLKETFSSKNHELIKKVDAIIESEQYSFLVELLQNGYQLNEDQRKKFFLLGYTEIKEINHTQFPFKASFNSKKWAEAIKEVSLYDKEIIKDSLNYLDTMLKTQKIQSVQPSWNKAILEKYDTLFIQKHCFDLAVKFLIINQEEILNNTNYEKISQILVHAKSINLESFYTMDENPKSLNQELIGQLSKLVEAKLKTEKENLISEVASQNINQALNNKVLKLRTQKAQEDMNINTFPKEAQEHYLVIQKNITSLLKNETLSVARKIELNDLVNNKLPQIVMDYLSFPDEYKNIVLPQEEKSVNALFIENLDNFSQLLQNIACENAQIDVSKFKETQAYLKSKM